MNAKCVKIQVEAVYFKKAEIELSIFIFRLPSGTVSDCNSHFRGKTGCTPNRPRSYGWDLPGGTRRSNTQCNTHHKGNSIGCLKEYTPWDNHWNYRNPAFVSVYSRPPNVREWMDPWILEIFAVESRILGVGIRNTALWIRNPTNVRNHEFHWQRIWNTLHRVRNPESKIVLDSFTCGEVGHSRCKLIYKLLLKEENLKWRNLLV